MEKQKYYKIFGFLFTVLGIIILLCINFQLIDSTYIFIPVMILSFAIIFLGIYSEKEKEKQWELAHEAQRTKIKQKYVKKAARDKVCRDIVLKIGVVVIIILGGIAIIL